MPTLREVQQAVARSLLARDDGAILPHIVDDAIPAGDRLDIYRNTFAGTLTGALRLGYPAVEKLVGREFFASCAAIFVARHPPRTAYLDDYGGELAGFLSAFPPAASLPYLPDVARLEWAVTRALHAPDADALDLSRLSPIDPADHGRVVFAPHPSVGLVQADHPVDEIWRSVLAQDEAAMTAVDLDAGPVWLLVQRLETGVDVRRIGEPAWRFMATLCAGRPLQDAIASAPDVDATTTLAEHLAAGRFIGFEILGRRNVARAREALA